MRKSDSLRSPQVDVAPSACSAYDFAWIMSATLALTLVIGKCLKFWLTYQVFEHWQKSSWLWTIPSYTTFRVSLVTLFCYLIWRKLVPLRWRWTFPFVMLLGYLGMRFAIGLLTGRANLTEFYTLKTLGHELYFLAGTFARDAGFVFLYFAALYYTLWATPEGLRPRVALLFAWLTAILLALVGLEVGYFSRTGQNATFQLLHYTASNFFTIAPLIALEFNRYNVAAIFFGPCLLFAAYSYQWSLPPRIPGRRFLPRHAVLSTTLGALLVSPYAPQPDSPHYARFSRNVFEGLVRDAVASPFLGAQQQALAEIKHAGSPRWYSSNVRAFRQGQAPKYNVVILMMESMRAKSTSLHDPSLATTPFLEQLAKRSAMVEHMDVVVPRTAAAWISVLYGMYPISDIAARPWVSRQAHDPGPQSLAEILRQYGYASAFFSGTGLEIDNETDIVKNLRFDMFKYERDYDTHGEGRVNAMGPADEVMLDPIREWIGSQLRVHRPFLLTVMTCIGHGPMKTPRSWGRKSFTKPGNYNDYLNCVAYGDSFARRLYQELAKAGVLENTIFIVLGDHGHGLGEHQSYDMRTLHEEYLHVPTVISAPQFHNRGFRIAGLRQQIDILPTVTELLGVRMENASLPGRSLLAPPADRSLYFSGSIDESYLGLRRGNLKYIYSFDRTPLEIYDLGADPQELHPRYGNRRDHEAGAVVDDILLWHERSLLSLTQAPTRASAASRTHPLTRHGG